MMQQRTSWSTYSTCPILPITVLRHTCISPPPTTPGHTRFLKVGTPLILHAWVPPLGGLNGFAGDLPPHDWVIDDVARANSRFPQSFTSEL